MIITLDIKDDPFPDPGLLADLGHAQTSPAPRSRQNFADAHTAPPLLRSWVPL
jgi:hypothetical protein